MLLREESACQQSDNDSDADVDDDDTEHDEVLMDAVSDILPAFAKSMGSHFAPIFAKLFDPLMKFAVGWQQTRVGKSFAKTFNATYNLTFLVYW